MIGGKWMVAACATIAWTASMSTAAVAADFEPFSQIEDVCPSCDKPAADVVTLTSGDKIRGTVVAENNEFYTVVRYGEVRAIPGGDVETIAWADGSKPASLADKDQLVLTNGHVLSGTITDETDEPAFFQIESSFSDQVYTVAKSQVKQAFKDGSVYQFDTAAGDK